MKRRAPIAATMLCLALTVGCGDDSEKAESSTEPRSGVVRVEGAELNYVIEGSGPVVLVIGSSVYYPRTFSSQLRDRATLVFVDLRHFVPSTGELPAEQITIETYADDIEQVRRELGLGTVTVLGHSIHGNLALEYARRYPEHVSGVVAIGSPPVGLVAMALAGNGYWATDASLERKAALTKNWEERGAAIESMSAEEGFVAGYVANGPRYWYDFEYDSTPLWEGMQINAEVSERLFGELFHEYDLGGDVSIDAPVLVVMGPYDFVVPHFLWDDQLEQLSDHEYVLLEKSGHTPQLEEPSAFDEALVEWLGRRQP